MSSIHERLLADKPSNRRRSSKKGNQKVNKKAIVIIVILAIIVLGTVITLIGRDTGTSHSVMEAPTIRLVYVNNMTVHKGETPIVIEVTDRDLASVYGSWDGAPAYSMGVSAEVANILTYLPMSDGIHYFRITATDLEGNVKSRSFVFESDNTPPEFSTPGAANISVQKSGGFINISVVESHLYTVQSFWDHDNATFISYPYQTPVPDTEGAHWLTITCTDICNNSRTKSYLFIADVSAPIVDLIAPNNDSFVQSDVEIELYVFDLHLDSVWYDWDNSTPQFISHPYNITFPAGEVNRTLQVCANDTVGTVTSAYFYFYVDDTMPAIQTQNVTIQNDSEIWQGNELVFNFTDSHIAFVRYWWDDGNFTYVLTSPFSITIPEIRGEHTLNIEVTDLAGNTAKNQYVLDIKGDGGLMPIPGFPWWALFALGVPVLIKKRH
jgi:hypothetical protein